MKKAHMDQLLRKLDGPPHPVLGADFTNQVMGRLGVQSSAIPASISGVLIALFLLPSVLIGVIEARHHHHRGLPIEAPPHVAVFDLPTQFESW